MNKIFTDNKSFICYNEDAIVGMSKLDSNSVDIIITDPPYGIEGDKLHRHYNRDEKFVIDGYVEVAKNDYEEFTNNWIAQSIRLLRNGGSMYIVSGYTNLIYILNALNNNKDMIERNHIIWKYNFGVYTTKKYVSSHYHILYYTKGNKNITFNTDCRYTLEDRKDNGGSLRYNDMEDVWIINREYKRCTIKNKNQLPAALLEKMIKYSSNENDLILDPFAGSFSTMNSALNLKRRSINFELNKNAFEYMISSKNKENTKGKLLKLNKFANIKGIEYNIKDFALS